MPKTLLAQFTVKPGHEGRVRDMMTALTRQVRKEPGNLVFEPYVIADSPLTYVVFERYQNDEAFQAHIAAPYGAAFNDELTDHIEGVGSELTFLTPFDS